MSSEEETIEKIRGYCDYLQANVNALDGQECRSLPYVVTGTLSKEDFRLWISKVRDKCSTGPMKNPTYTELLQALEGWPINIDPDWIVRQVLNEDIGEIGRARQAQLLKNRWEWLFNYDSMTAEHAPSVPEWDLPPEHPDKTTQDGIPFWDGKVPNEEVYNSTLQTNIDLWEEVVLVPYLDKQQAAGKQKKKDERDKKKALRDEEKLKVVQKEQLTVTAKKAKDEADKLKAIEDATEKQRRAAKKAKRTALKKKMKVKEDA